MASEFDHLLAEREDNKQQRRRFSIFSILDLLLDFVTFLVPSLELKKF